MFTLIQAKKYFQKTRFRDVKCSVIQIKESTNNKIFEHNNVILKKYTYKWNYVFERQCVQDLLSKKKQYFPRILLDDPQNRIIIFNKLSWETLDKVRLKLSKQQQSLYITKLIKVLKEFHTIAAPMWYSFEKYLKSEITKYYQKAIKNPHISKEKLKILYEYIIKYLNIFSQQKQILIYSDFWVKNILSNQKNITGIIDFETWCYGPLCLEWYKIQHTRFYIKDWGDDTSVAEQDFMRKFIMNIKKIYPKIFISTIQQDKVFQGIHYIKLLSRWRQKWYTHQEVEKFRKEFL